MCGDFSGDRRTTQVTNALPGRIRRRRIVVPSVINDENDIEKKATNRRVGRLLASPPGVVGISIVVVHGDRRRLQCSSSTYPFFRLRRKIHRQLPNIRPEVEDAQDATRTSFFIPFYPFARSSFVGIISHLAWQSWVVVFFGRPSSHNRKASSLIHARSSADLSFLGEADDGTSPRGNDGRSFPRNYYYRADDPRSEKIGVVILALFLM